MAKSQQTFNKKEKERKRLQKQKDKAQRKEERKANAREGKGLEDMLAYVDENGNISSTPPDPTKKRQINEAEIELGSRNKGGSASPGSQTGKVTFFDSSKGFGFIQNDQSGERVFFHVSEVTFDINEGDRVAFEPQWGPKGMTAVNVRKTGA